MLSNQSKRELANKMIEWLKSAYPNLRWNSTNEMADMASKALDEPKYDIWKIHDLLRTLGRIEFNSPNGRKGGRLVNDTPVELPLITERKCDPHRCPIVKAVFRTFPELMNT